MHSITWSLPVTNPVLIFAIVMFIILVAPLVFERLKIPGIIGLIVSGVVVGPYALGLLQRDETMDLLGTVGLLYIMFVAGLEVDLNQFIKYRRRSIGFSVYTFGIPQILGTLVGLFLLNYSWTTSILLGSIIASHTLLAYPIVSRMGLSKNTAVVTAVGATILTDTAALLVLAVIAGSAEGELTGLFGIRLVLSLAVFMLLVFGLLPRIGRWFFRHVAQGDGISGFVFVLTAVFASSFLAEVAGVEPIIGAFMAGLGLNRLVPDQGTLMNRIQFVGESLFIPFFLLSVGMLVDLSVFFSGIQIWFVATYMIGAVILAKWTAAYLARFTFGYTADESWTIFGLTLAQAAATLAAVLVGYELKLLDANVLNGTILMILVTCLIAPWVSEKYGRRVALTEEIKPFHAAEAPERLLVPMTQAENSVHLMDLALMIRDRRSHEPIYPLSVARSGLTSAAAVLQSEKTLSPAIEHATAAGIPVAPLTRVDYNVADGITRAIVELRISTVILGWNGENTARNYVFGRVVDPVLTNTRTAVIVCQFRWPVNTHRNIVMAVPPYAWREQGFADLVADIKRLAVQLGAGLTVMTTADQKEPLESLYEMVRPSCPLRFVYIDSWTNLVTELEAGLSTNDLLVVVSAREGTISWRPSLKRLPRVLGGRLPNVSRLYFFPSEMRSMATLPGAIEPGREGTLFSVRDIDVVFGLETADWPETIDALLKNHTQLTPETKELIRADLLDVDLNYSFELLTGVTLLHATRPGFAHPLIVAGVSDLGLNLPRTASLVHLVVLVVSSFERESEADRQLLAHITEWVRTPDLIDRLKKASTANEVRSILAEPVATF